MGFPEQHRDIADSILYSSEKSSKTSSDYSVYKSRHDLMEEECVRLSFLSPKFAKSQKVINPETPLLVEVKHRILYCPLAKSGTTILRSFLQMSSGVKNVSNIYDIIVSRSNGRPHDDSLKRLNLNLSGMSESLHMYRKFIFVRNPYFRLFSAYISKFFAINIQYWQQMGRSIIAIHRENASERSLKCGHDVTFPEFIKRVISDIGRNSQVDRHWEPMYLRCQPCAIHYDVIGKLETIEEDMHHLVERFNLSAEVSLEYTSGDLNLAQIITFTKDTFGDHQRLPSGCMSVQDTLDRALRRHQIQGLIRKSVTISGILYEESRTLTDILTIFTQAYRNSGLMSASVSKTQKREAYVEAYSLVPLDDIKQIRSLYYADFSLSEYDPEPSELFNVEIRKRKQDGLYFT